MAYAKKFLILKELAPGFSVNGRPLSGIARAEQSDSVTEINLSLINFAAVTEGGYRAVILFPDGKMYAEDLGPSLFLFQTVRCGHTPRRVRLHDRLYGRKHRARGLRRGRT